MIFVITYYFIMRQGNVNYFFIGKCLKKEQRRGVRMIAIKISILIFNSIYSILGPSLMLQTIIKISFWYILTNLPPPKLKNLSRNKSLLLCRKSHHFSNLKNYKNKGTLSYRSCEHQYKKPNKKKIKINSTKYVKISKNSDKSI